MYFGIMEPHKFWEQSIVRKVYTSESRMTKCGNVLLTLEPEETEYLLPGTYYYMVKLLRQDEDGKEDVTTIVNRTLFYIV